MYKFDDIIILNWILYMSINKSKQKHRNKKRKKPDNEKKTQKRNKHISINLLMFKNN